MFADDIYNDLGFVINKKLIVLVEAQSTWSVNIILRSLLYFAQTLKNYIDEEQYNLYGRTGIPVPKPELYVIYTGNEKIDKEVISLSEEFFHGEESAIEVKVRVLTDGKQGDIIYQYIAFTKIYNEQVKICESKEEAIKETIRICKDRNILKKFISKHEAEVINIMSTLFDEKNVMKAFVKEKREEGIEIGRQEGIETGRQEGIETGRQEGIETGRQEGIEIGRQEGIETGRQEGIEIGRQEGIETGRQEGVELGVNKRNQEIANKLKTMGYSEEQIAVIVG